MTTKQTARKTPPTKHGQADASVSQRNQALKEIMGQFERFVELAPPGKIPTAREIPEGLLVTFVRPNKPKAVSKTARSKTEPSLESLMADAEARGTRRVLEVLAGDDMLNLEEAEAVSEISRKTLNTRRQAGILIGLAKPGLSRGFRYPRWHFETNLVYRIPRVLTALAGLTGWEAYFFMVSPHPVLGGRSPVEALRTGREVEVRRLAEAIARGDQGAA